MTISIRTNPLKPSLRVTVTLKGFGQRPINGASILVNRTRSKQLFHTSQNRPSFCAFYWVTTLSSAKRVSGWPRERNIGGVTGELRRLGLKTTKENNRIENNNDLPWLRQYVVALFFVIVFAAASVEVDTVAHIPVVIKYDGPNSESSGGLNTDVAATATATAIATAAAAGDTTPVHPGRTATYRWVSPQRAAGKLLPSFVTSTAASLYQQGR